MTQPPAKPPAKPKKRPMSKATLARIKKPQTDPKFLRMMEANRRKGIVI